MNREEYNQIVEDTWEDIKRLNRDKGNDYAGNEDVTNNFKKNGVRLNLDPKIIWGVYFFKHVDAIETFIREGTVKSEDILERVDDMIVYLLLFKALVAENSEFKTSSTGKWSWHNLPQLDIGTMKDIAAHTTTILGPEGQGHNPHYVTRNNGIWELTQYGWTRKEGNV